MSSRNDDPTRSFEREMRRAERERRQLMALGALAVAMTLAVIGVIAVVALVGRAPSDGGNPPATASSTELPSSTPDQALSSGEESVPVAEAAEATSRPAPKSAATKPAKTAKAAPRPEVQRFSLGIGQYGYDPEVITAKAGVPIELTVAQGEGCAAGFLMSSLGIDADNSAGPAVVDLPALKPGSYQFTCGMAMVSGTLVVR